MGARIAGTRVLGTSVVVLLCLTASSGRANDALAGAPGPIRRSVAQRNDLHARFASGPLGAGPVRRNHAREGAIAGAVVGGALGGLYLGGLAAFGCGARAHPDGCGGEMFLYAAAGAAGGAIFGGGIGSLIGTWFQTAPSTRVEPSRDRTRLSLLPRRRGVGVALVHSF